MDAGGRKILRVRAGSLTSCIIVYPWIRESWRKSRAQQVVWEHHSHLTRTSNLLSCWYTLYDTGLPLRRAMTMMIHLYLFSNPTSLLLTLHIVNDSSSQVHTSHPVQRAMYQMRTDNGEACESLWAVLWLHRGQFCIRPSIHS